MEDKKTPKADLQNKKALFFEIGLCVSLFLIIIAFRSHQEEVTIQLMETTTEIIEMEIVEITREEQKPPEVRQQQVQVTSDILNIVRDDRRIEASLTFSDFDQDAEFTFQPAAGGGTAEEFMDDGELFMNVDEMPQFQGGDNVAFRSWVMGQIRYPAAAQENGVQGRVTLGFVVERDGSVSNIEVLHTPDRSLGEEAVRVVRSSPKWTPGKQRGVPVRVRFTLPVEFQLQ